MDNRTEAEKAMDRFVSDIHNWSTERPAFEKAFEKVMSQVRADIVAGRPYHFVGGDNWLSREVTGLYPEIFGQPKSKEKMMNKITMEGNWQTEDGRSVRIISLDGPKDTPVVGVIEGNPNVLAWQADGQYNPGVSHCTNLVPVPTKHEGWCVVRNNMWWDGSVYIRSSYEEALVEKERLDKVNPKEQHRIARVTWEN